MMRIPVFGLVQIILASTLTMQQQDFDPTTHSSWHLVNDQIFNNIPLTVCGLQPAVKIFGGQNAGLGEFPWMVHVMVDKINDVTGEKLFHICGGSIISKKYILSAAHCFAIAKYSISNITIRVGEYDLTQDPDCDSAGVCAPSAIEYPTSKVTVHPDFTPEDPDDPDDYNALADIAVVKIDGEFIFSDFVLPICLEYGDLLEQDYAGEIAETIGWGVWGVVGNETQYPVTLQKVSLEIIDVNICTQLLGTSSFQNNQLYESHICAGTQTKFSHSGDSGSPLFIAKSVDGGTPRQYQIGVFVSEYGINDTYWYGGKPPN
ncbi:hypothetical protein LSTR_LSTR006760 [Laodelphax striatellus]|uniref:Peptidase S1 domain-containing protein n=1 Tax=Laodelphax striatellus TaxID=195883 RepID=A0A482XE40_LAOST|nr:hypothetical protein LSTR_LSTR006760 [Laodelphax striatellus]